jgi:uncharacterized DUF497 family protein
MAQSNTASATDTDDVSGRHNFAWDDAKNAKLKAERGIGFEEIVFHIERGDLLDILEHPNLERYAGQRLFVVQRDDYVYLVPFVEDEHTVFLKDDHSESEGHEAVHW